MRKAFPQASILRPSILFGVEDQFFNRFASMPFIPLIGGGDTLFQPLYVEDLARAAEAVWNGNDTAGKIYELGGPQVLSFRECMEVMLDVIGEARPMITIPWGLAEIMMAFGSLPGAPITADQVKSLTADNIVADNALTMADLGIGFCQPMFGRTAHLPGSVYSRLNMESWARTAANKGQRPAA